MKMRALQAFSYNHRDLRPGDVFETKTNLHAQILVQNGRAEYAQAEKQTASLKAQDAESAEQAHDREPQQADTPQKNRRGRPRKDSSKVGTSGRGLVHRYRTTNLEAEDS